MRHPTWQEVGPGVLVQRHTDLDVNCGLVIGQRRAVVIDTALSARHGADLLASVREVTDVELTVVNTHAHFDHCFGNIAFRDSQIYAHVGAADAMLEAGESQRAAAIELLTDAGLQQAVSEVSSTETVLPFYLIEADTALNIGGRSVHLLYGGPAHTDHDLVVAVPDAGVVFWGDLIEQGAEVSTQDAYLGQWPATLEALLAREVVSGADVAVPGHGEVVGPDYLRWQIERVRELARADDTSATAQANRRYLHSRGSSANH